MFSGGLFAGRIFDSHGYYFLDHVFLFFASLLFLNVKCIGNYFLLKELPLGYLSRPCIPPNPPTPIYIPIFSYDISLPLFFPSLVSFSFPCLCFFRGYIDFSFFPSVACISHWFRKRRAIAMGILYSGSSVGGVV